jgi:hypothetical protein
MNRVASSRAAWHCDGMAATRAKERPYRLADAALRSLLAAAMGLRRALRDRRSRQLDLSHLAGMSEAELEHFSQDVALPPAELKAQLTTPRWRR